MEAIGCFPERVHIDRRPCRKQLAKEFLQLLVHGAVDRVSGTEQHGVEVPILLQVLLVEGQFAVARLGFPEAPDRGEAFGAEIGAHMLDTPQSVRSRLRPKSHCPGRVQEVGFDVTRHEPPLLRFQVRPCEGGEVHVGAGQGNAGRVLIQFELLRIDLFDRIEVVVEAPRFIGHFAEHFRQIDLVQGEHLTDDVEHAIAECVAHPVQLAQQALQDAPLNDRLAVLRGSGDEVERIHVTRLPDAVDAAQPLLEAGRVPGQVVVDHQVAELEVDAFAGRLRRHANLTAGPEVLLRLFAIARVHPAVDFAGRIAPGFEMVPQVVQRVAVLGKDEQLAPSVLQLLELRPLQALAQRDELGVAAVFAHPADARRQVPERRHLGPDLIQFEGRGGFADERVTGGLIEIVLFLLRVGYPAGDLCKPLGPLRRG